MFFVLVFLRIIDWQHTVEKHTINHKPRYGFQDDLHNFIALIGGANTTRKISNGMFNDQMGNIQF